MMSYPMTQIGGKAFNHSSNSSSEAEYDRLRDQARGEAAKRSSCMERSHQAYERGDGAGAHQLSEEGKKHGAQMDAFNKQAADFIFRENNAVGRVADDTIDLHGLFVNEAEEIVEQRIRYATQQGQTHLHVIVGKGNHSRDHVQKIKPRVEQICQELGLQYATEENAGRMYINLAGGPAVMPPHHDNNSNNNSHQGGYGQSHGPNQNSGYNTYPAQQQQHQQQGYNQNQNQNQNQNDELEQLAVKMLPRVLKKLEGCCAVM